jgi:hypothetical protein
MITLGICLIYYGIALFLYQIYGWLSAGVWTPFPVSRAWEGFFGAPRLTTPIFDDLVNWFLAWPLGFALLIGGLCLLGAAFGFRRVMELRRNRLRLKWLLEQCKAAGYKPWAVPKVIRELEDRISTEKASHQKRIG